MYVERGNRRMHIGRGDCRVQICRGNRWMGIGKGNGRSGLGVAERTAVSVQAGLHACDLAGGEHEHGIVVGIVHVVHEQVATRPVAARHMWEYRLAEIGPGRIGRVGDQIVSRATATVIAPDMAEVEPVPDFMGGGPAMVIGRESGGRSNGAEGRVQNYHTVCRCRPTRELCIAKQSLPEFAHPKIEVFRRIPSVGTAGGCRFDLVVVDETVRDRLRAGDSVRGRSVRICRRQHKFDPRIRGQWLEYGGQGSDIGIRFAIIAVQHIDLALHLGVGNVLVGGFPHHMGHDGDNGDSGPLGGNEPPVVLECAGFAGRSRFHIAWHRTQESLMHLHGATGTLFGWGGHGASPLFYLVTIL